MEIRLTTKGDSAALLRIYAQYIDTPITFETVLPSEREFTARFASISGIYPCLVAGENGRIIGYAYAHRQMERAAYQWNAELSIYLDRAFTSRGLGRKLYAVLMEILKRQGIKTVYGGGTVPNPAREKLHLALGFRRIGIYRRTGYKCGAWHDVAWFEKAIAPCRPEPEPVLPVERIPAEKLDALIRKYQ
ncbi:GNAT family N-acetyltransferase [Victivallis sp. Marseille-Q1083]|uniref:GNAT family N-acetyltransferase n=1 Tax=Victivallis sp. Marseille-Q1083 TaxID=2717288 RepID=UPI00158BCF62|nr:GNAT family N-acetyltransferase [Victivallis sp. Marseille-Q1083]